MSRLLISEEPLIINADLAKSLNCVEAAAMLQQFHFWIIKPDAIEIENKKWHKASYEDLHKTFFWTSKSSLRKIISFMENIKIIISKEFDLTNNKKTKYYTIDYEELEKYCGKVRDSLLTDSKVVY